MTDQQDQRHPAEHDIYRAETVVRELLDEFPHPDTGHALPGLLNQAWNLSNAMLLSKGTQNNEGGGYRKPGSRPPSALLLKLMADVQSCLDYAHQTAADDLGCFVNSGEQITALRRIPALLEATVNDCTECERCYYGANSVCTCRHRLIVRRLNKHYATLGADLLYWEHPVEKPLIDCPGCGRAGQVVIRKDQERMYCRYDDCDWHREGIFAILAVAS
jgi:hypothetical protein